MAKETINIGTSANDGTGDTLRVAFGKTNNNFSELYTDVDNLKITVVQSDDLAAVATSGDYDDLVNTPAIFDGSYNSLSDVPSEFAPSPHSHVLADITDAGTAAATDATAYATAAQGAKADTSVQPGDDAADLGSGAAVDGYVLTSDGAGGAAWEAASGGGGTPGGSDTQVQFNDVGVFGGDAGFAFNKTAKTLTVGGGTIATNSPIINMAQTWNASGTTFTGLLVNVTDTASAAASKLVDLQVAGSSRFSITKAGVLSLVGTTGKLTMNDSQGLILEYSGTLTLNGQRSSLRGGSYALSASNNQGCLAEGGFFGFATTAGGNGSVYLAPDGNGALGVRLPGTGTTGQTFNIYNAYTNASNYERARLGWAGNAFEIMPEAAGTGTTRVLHISGLPTSNPGPGILWNDGGTVKVGT